MTRYLWRVTPPDGDALTVIAATPGEARDIAMAHRDDDGDRRQYLAAVLPAGGLRWVGFDNPSDVENQVRDLCAVGVPLDCIWTRTTFRPDIDEVLWEVDEILWEVGARDADWCLLPAGVLCGGAD